MRETQVQAQNEGTISAGEVGPEGQSAAEQRMPVEIIIGEIPDEKDPTSMLWTARCSDPRHDLLGRFPTREEAERSKDLHLRQEHQEE